MALRGFVSSVSIHGPGRALCSDQANIRILQEGSSGQDVLDLTTRCSNQILPRSKNSSACYTYLKLSLFSLPPCSYKAACFGNQDSSRKLLKFTKATFDCSLTSPTLDNSQNYSPLLQPRTTPKASEEFWAVVKKNCIICFENHKSALSKEDSFIDIFLHH